MVAIAGACITPLMQLRGEVESRTPTDLSDFDPTPNDPRVLRELVEGGVGPGVAHRCRAQGGARTRAECGRQTNRSSFDAAGDIPASKRG
ncbi:hypothetical protein [Herbaspirillum lusitanum]|uniref:hypothetical protein n=1 Tax=Herbaspirillum lusitanum TaxID=213312 RepID=UPI0002DD38E9|nr:hypothetical protein [Herbaspirillum lusitanum]